ncbi:kinesin 3 [Perilla frutescens var. hirtella]|nr:kinesin 3 [Perilla frutescens var. hirtella]
MYEFLNLVWCFVAGTKWNTSSDPSNVGFNRTLHQQACRKLFCRCQEMKSPSTVFLLIFIHNGDGAAAANRVNGPVMLQKFDSGVMVIQSKTHSDEESTVDTQGSAKRLKQCVKWFQQLEGNYATEQEKLKNLLEVAEKKCSDVELMMKENEDELNSIIMELRKNLDMLQEKHAKKELDKLKVQASLLEELKRTQEDNASNLQKIQSLNDIYKRLQEYNTSLQLYNSRLQSELHETNETLKHVEKEKTAVVEKP